MRGIETKIELEGQLFAGENPMPRDEGYPPEVVSFVFALAERGEDEAAYKLLDDYDYSGMHALHKLCPENPEYEAMSNYLDELNWGTEEQQIFGEYLGEAYDKWGVVVWRGMKAYWEETENQRNLNPNQLVLEFA